MKLGIVVIYLARKEDEKLLDIHLSQIERYTDVPYTIYAAANRLIPDLRTKLESQPHLKIGNCRSTDLRGMKEHSFYLAQLVDASRKTP